MMKNLRTLFMAMLSLCSIAIIVSFTSCAKFRSMVAPKTPFNPAPTEESASNSPSSASSITDGKGMIHQETEKYEVTASFLNVRKTASAKASIVGGLKKGDKVDVYGFEGNWAEIGFKDKKAFVYMEHIKKSDVDVSETQRTDSSVLSLTPKKQTGVFDSPSKDVSGDYTSTKTLEQNDNEELVRWKMFSEYVIEGKEHFDQKRYAAAAKSYNKALKYHKDASVYYNLGVAQLKNEKFNKAKNAFENAYEEAQSRKNSELASKALDMRNKSAELAKEKSKQGWLTAAVISLIVVDVILIGAANAQLEKLEMEQQKRQNKIKSNVVNNNNHLLDPNYAIWQTQQQQAQMDAVQQQLIEQTVKQTEKEMEEFNRIQTELINLSIQQTAQQEYDTYLLMTSGGTSMSFEEWKAIRWQSVAQEAMDETYNYNEDFNYEVDIDENKYKGKLSPEQYQEAYRRWENSAQGHYNALTIGGVRSQDSQGNIKGQTVGQMAGGSYKTHKMGLTKAQNEMRRIRQEASQYGVNIQQSQWETATAGY